MNLANLIPGLGWVREYKSQWLNGDLSAGLTVGVMLIPQGMAYAMIAGLPPIYGLYASILPILVYAVFGTSRQLGVGPVALVSLLVASGVGAVAEAGSGDYISAAILLALIVGGFQFLIGILRFGFLVNFLSHPVVSGFTSAAALIIGLSQIKHLLGVDIPRSKHLHELLASIFEHGGAIHLPTLAIGLGGIGIILLARRINRKIPAPLLAVIFGILLVKLLNLSENGVAIVGEVPSGLPGFVMPTFSIELFQQLFPIALTIALISFMESYAVAKAIQRKHKNYEIDANKELIALGLANIVGSFFKAYPTTGGFSRSAVNDQAGANTGLAGIFAALLIILTLLFLTPLFYFLPKAILASVIMVAVVGLIDVREVRFLWKTDRRDLVMLLATFFSTAFLGLEIGIGVGVTLSILALVYRSSRPHYAVLGEVQQSGIYRNIKRFPEAVEDDKTLILRTDAEWFYANTTYVLDAVRNELAIRPETKRVLIDAASISDMDSSAIHMVKDLHSELQNLEVRLDFANLIGPVRDKFEKAGLFDTLGKSAFHSSVRVAMGRESHPEEDLELQTGIVKRSSKELV